jgi:hypothetical protein
MVRELIEQFKTKKEELSKEEYEKFLRIYSIGGSIIFTAVSSFFTYIYISTMEARAGEWDVIGSALVALTALGVIGILYAVGRIILRRKH